MDLKNILLKVTGLNDSDRECLRSAIEKDDLRSTILDVVGSIPRLSIITYDSGDLFAGRFIAPAPAATSTEPTETGFTGSFMSGRGETFGGSVYNTGGVNAGVLQWGANQTDGKLYAGAGVIQMDSDGVTIETPAAYSETNSYKFMTGTTFVGGMDAKASASGVEVRVRSSNSGASNTATTYLQAVSENLSSVYINAFGSGVSNYGTVFLSVVNGETTACSIQLKDEVITLGKSASDIVKIDASTNKAYYNNTELNTASPITCNMLTRDPTSVGQGTWARSVNANFLYNGNLTNTSHANGDNFTVNFYLPAGTYKLRFNSAKNTDRCIIKVEVDSTNLGNTDLYAASADRLNVVEYTGISMTSVGLKSVKFTVNGKNGSSSDYYFDVSEIEFIRTA